MRAVEPMALGKPNPLGDERKRLIACVKSGDALIDSIYEIVGCNLPESWPEKTAYLADRAALGEVEP